MNQASKKVNTSTRIGKFAIIGIILSLSNFAIYTFLARVIFNSNELLWLDSIISYTLATVLAYLLHSKITWKERSITKRGIIMFFLWNGIAGFLISPFLTWLFGFITPVYEFAHQIISNLGIPFDYNFVESTGIFCFTTAVIMVLNYLFYDKLVFGSSKTADVLPPSTSFLESHSKVSIIVPVYNTAKYLPNCLDSIIKQTYSNLEIILVDDGSTDDSPNIVDNYAKKDKRIKVIHQKNAGQSTARNQGLKKSTGKFISFLDADDYIKPTFITDLLSHFSGQTSLTVCGIHYRRLKAHSAEDVYINPLRSRKKNESKKAYLLHLLAIDGRMYSSVNKLYLGDIARKITFDTKLNFAEDTKYVLDYLAKTNGDPTFVLKPLYIYNFGTETSTINQSAIKWQNWQTSYKNLKNWLGPHPSIKEKFWLHIIHLRWRISYVRSKRRAK